MLPVDEERRPALARDRVGGGEPLPRAFERRAARRDDAGQRPLRAFGAPLPEHPAAVVIAGTLDRRSERALGGRAGAARVGELSLGRVAGGAEAVAVVLRLALSPLPFAFRVVVRARHGVDPPCARAEGFASQGRQERAIVRDNDPDPAKTPQRGHEPPARLRIQVVRRLVEEQDVGLPRESAPHLPALSFAGRERAPAGERNGVEVERGAESVRLRILAQRERGDVVAHGVNVLRARHDERVVRRASDVACVRPQRAGEEAQERGLAGAVRPDEPVPAGREMEIALIEQRNRVAISERDPLHEESLHAWTPGSWRGRGSSPRA